MAQYPRCPYRSAAYKCVFQVLAKPRGWVKYLGKVAYGCKNPDRASYEDREFCNISKPVRMCLGYKTVEELKGEGA